MQGDRIRQQLAGRLFDKGIHNNMPSVYKSREIQPDRPLTAKIALRAQLNQSKGEKLPSIHEQLDDTHNRSHSQQKQYQLNTTTRGKSQNQSKTMGDTRRNITYDLTQEITLDERRLGKSKQILELMDKMVGKQKAVPSPRIVKTSQKMRTTVLPISILDEQQQVYIQDGNDNARVRKAIRTASQKGNRQLNRTVQSKLSDSEGSDGEQQGEDGAFKLRDVDTFIQMVREHKLSQMEFMYLVKNKNNSNDAYNMRVVSYHYIQKHKIHNYYTLSVKGLTRYENHISIEFVRLGDWLTEREQFNAIKSLSFFRKFRMWKTLKKWVKTLHQSKVRMVQKELTEKMLILNPIYQKLIVQHRSLCYDMESLRIVEVQQLEECKNLTDFSSAQHLQRNILVQKLQLQSDKMRENCQQGLRTVIDKLRYQIKQEISSDKDNLKEQGRNALDRAVTQIKQVDLKKQIIESFGFPENMNYGLRALMRSEFVKFLRLAYLLDFIAVQSLGLVYVKSCSEFLDKLTKVQESCLESRRLIIPHTNIDDEDQRPYDNQDYDPIFQMQLQWNQDNDDEIITEVPVEWDGLEHELLNFDLQPNILLKQAVTAVVVSNESKNKNKKEEVSVSSEDLVMTHKREVTNLHQLWLLIEPNQSEFQNRIQETFSDGLDSIQVIERWSKHPEFLPYIQALEEWDEIIGEKWAKPDSNYLNPSYWIKEHPMHDHFLISIQDQLDLAFQKLQQFQLEFNDYTNLVWRQENSDVMELGNPQLKYQAKIFQLCLKSGQAVEQIMKTQLVPQIDIGLFRIKIDNIQKILISKSQNHLVKIEEIFIQTFRKRAASLKLWLQTSIKSLSGMVIKIEEFIEQKNSVDRITKLLPEKREDVEILTGLLILMQDCALTSVKKEDKELSQDLNFLEGGLNVALSEADNNTAKNIERFKKTLKDRIDRLKSESVDLLEQITRDKYLTLVTPLEESIEELTQLDIKTKQLEAMAQKYSEYEEILQCQEQAIYEQLENGRDQLNLRLGMWSGIKEFKQLSQEWIQLPFSQINAKDMAMKTEQYVRIVLRSEKLVADNKVIQYLKKIVWEFKDTIPVVTSLRSQYLGNNHWAEIKALVRQEFDVNNVEFTLNKLLDLNVAAHVESITEIAVKAAQEDALQVQLRDIETHWAEIDLKLKPYKDTVDTMVLGEVEELIQNFDDGLANLSNILASRYVRPLRPKAEKLYSDIMLLSDIVDKWVECQKKWMYLESIFSSQDIKKNLTNESQQFDGCDKMIKKLVKTVNLKPLILRLLTIPNLLDNLNKCQETLELIEKSLETYLEDKRTSFPRFYFLSNEELLEILAKQADIEATQYHLPKCFEALVKLSMGEQSNIIQGFQSPEGELIPLFKSVAARGNVEVWLKQLEVEMIDSLRKLIKQGMMDYLNGIQKTKQDWILCHKSQIVTVVSQILWSVNSEDAISESSTKSSSLSEWFDLMVLQLSQLTQLVRGELTQIQRKTIVALITTDVHNRDIISKLADTGVELISDFYWQQQLRYYWDEEVDDCLVRQVNSMFHYGYEYLGATTRLVITPLTDRCWITVTSALSNQLGAAPAGPAGTGKTESVKDLAKGLGRYCIVFNCSDQITAATMNKLFSGLVQQGAWACLDEFNRIDIEVLSVIAQQLLIIRMALLQDMTEFTFDGRLITMRTTFGIFITMNPGYAGRTELPDNLKSLFRPVSMMIPDYRLIAEIMLYAEGFENASELSSKMVQLYKLSSQQLSQQDHYDFGMRAVKSLLVMAGSLKRADPALSEQIVLIRAMRDANIPKFLKDDLPLFSALIQDLFPSVILPKVESEQMETNLKNKCQQMNLQIIDALITKSVQLYDTLNVRFGTMIVGQSGAGKTKCYQLLAETLSGQGQQLIKYYILNPKSINMGELYGEVDQFTNEWQDGLASSLIRECNTSGNEGKHWIVFDGPVDALWIENMNSVLDDSMTLCLANSERIKLRQELRMIFEVSDLSVASPATVSRCGMVYMTADELPWSAYVESWINSQFKEIPHIETKHQCCTQFKHTTTDRIPIDSKYIELIRQLFKVSYTPLLHNIQLFDEPFQTINIQRVTNVCNLFQQFIADIVIKYKDDISKKLTTAFAYSVIWGLCISFDQKHYDKITTYVKDAFQQLLYPKCDTIFDFYLDTEDHQTFLPWDGLLQDFHFQKDLPYFSIMVPTTETLKFSFIIKMMVTMQKPTFVSGMTGVGKSMLVSTLLGELKQEQSVQPILLNFSAQTNPKQTQLAIEQKMNKKGKTLFGARVNESIAIFIDDVNMPALEPYGAQPCIELLRLWLDLHGFYDRSKLFWKHIEDSTLLCASGPPGGGRNKLSTRFLRQFNIINMPIQSDGILEKVYGSILKGYLHSINFAEPVRRMNESITRITIELFRRVSKELLPIPAKFHYTFNSRDISKVFQGLLMVKPISANNTDTFLKLWVHETARVFCDRLISAEDRYWFYQTVVELLARHFTINKDDISSTILFSDILKLEAVSVLYEEVTDKRQVLVNALSDKQEDYTMQTNDKLDLVFFDDALEHILRIARIIRQPRGNAMLIGVGGSGKYSLAKLASFLMRCDILQIDLIKNYNAESFRADLLKIVITSGVERNPLSFIFNESHIVYESFLEDINNLLNTGEVPNLFQKKEEFDQVYQGIRPYAIKTKRPDSPEALWNLFVEEVRNNLHIILCMSPVGDQLRVRSRKFPNLINCCTLDWYSQWPKQALLEVAQSYLDKVGNLPDNLAEMCTVVQLSVQDLCDVFYREIRRQVYITPKSYLDQIKLYTKLYLNKQQQLMTIQRKLADGLDKLFKANETVAILKIEMQDIQPQLVEQSALTEQFLRQLAIDQGEANLKERFVNDEAQTVNQQAYEIKMIADEAQSELNKALPALKEAEDALSRISKNDIAEVKGFINPPPIVVLVLEAVCTLLGEKTDWNSAKQVMVGNDFMERLVKFDKANIQDSTLRKLRMITNKPEFEPIFVGQKSQACKSLCMWCRAIDSFAKIAREVEPKRKKVSEMQNKLDLKNQELAVKQEQLQKVRDKVGKLQKDCDETIERKTQLEKELERTKKRLIAAEKLTLLLADEGIRWKEQIKSLEVVSKQIIGDVFLAASTISYLGAFTGPYRDTVVKQWEDKLIELGIPCSDSYTLSGTLENAITIRDWLTEGLPNDSVSIDNGIIATKCDRWPLMIDPQGQANKWLRQHYKEMRIVRFSDTHYLKTLQSSISSGFAILFEEVEELEPSIDSVLLKQIVEVEGRKLIRVGDQKIDYNQQFRLLMTTKLSNPQYLPEVFIKTTVINFSITLEGLQDQLLGEVMKSEKPDIEKQRDEIIITMSNATKQLKMAQDAILDLLANAEGMILDNDQLINTLELSKQQSVDISKSLEQTIKVEAQINESRNLYLVVAIRGAVLYFVVQDMSAVDPMYQYSLQYFKKLFQMALIQSQQSEVLQERLKNLEDTMTQIVYRDVCRGLFESHKRTFSFLICTSIKRQRGIISPIAWNLLLRDQMPTHPMPNPDKSFYKEQQWNLIQCIQEQIGDLSDMVQDLKNNFIFWKEYAANDDIFDAPFPSQSPLSTSNNFNPFYKLLIIKAIKPMKIMQSFISYVRDQLGNMYTEVINTTMEDVYQSSDEHTPIIFILSPGADPTQTLFKLAKEPTINTKSIIDVISLGQGQGKKAELMIAKAQKEGTWVLLQNCHLARSWLSQLEKIIEQLTSNSTEVHSNFRIFLTSMPAVYFPVSILQNGIKLTTEPPRGLKANLKRSYQESQHQIDQLQRPMLFRQLLFSISFFHAIIQERRKFGPLGFNKAYEFNDSDMNISVQMMKMFVNVTSEEEVPWDAMQFMIGQINYGGRVTDDQDRICLSAILKKYIGDHVEEKLRFSESGIYYIPNDVDIQGYIEYIDMLPTSEDPEVFGMHENATVIFQTQESQKVLETILFIQPRIQAVGGNIQSADQIVMDKALLFQSSLPTKLDKNQCNPRHFQLTDSKSIQSMSTVLLQEIDKFNNLLDAMSSSLTQLQMAIRGFVVMSSDLDQMYVAFLNNQIPLNWVKYSYSTLKPLANWYKDLLIRITTIRQWMEKDTIPAYWMSGLFYPQGFLTGVLQTHSRKYKIPINKLNFKFKVLDVDLDRIKEEPKDGVYVYGLYLEAARWDGSHETLIDQQLGQVYYPLSIVYFQPQEEYEAPEEYYSCPCYKTSNRVGVLSTTGQSTNFILSIDLPSKTEKPEFWTLRGTAIISQLND